jgi:hypothetical protein
MLLDLPCVKNPLHATRDLHPDMKIIPGRDGAPTAQKESRVIPRLPASNK